MPIITITRNNEFINRLRPYRIYMDGKPLGKIANGKTMEFTVPAGTHTLQAKIDWCGSAEVPFSVQEGDAATFHVGGFKGARIFIPAAIGLIVMQIVLSFFFDSNWLSIPALIILAFLIYIFTIGRNRYLTLSETNTAALLNSEEDAVFSA